MRMIVVGDLVEHIEPYKVHHTACHNRSVGIVLKVDGLGVQVKWISADGVTFWYPHGEIRRVKCD